MERMSDIVVRELDNAYANKAVVSLLAKVFDDKREALLGNKPGWNKIVESLLEEYEGIVLVAEVDGKLGGAAVFRGKEWHPGKRTAKTVISQLGILGSIGANRRLKKLAAGLPPLKDGEGMLDALGVRENFRRMGTGTLLLQKGEEWARNNGKSHICLSVKANNEPAINLYKKMGFEIAHRYSNLWGDNYYMRKNLKPTLHQSA